MKVTTQASLRSAVGWQPTSFCQRAASPKTSAATARLAVSYSPTDDALSNSLEPPTEAKPAVRVSSGSVSGALMVPSKSEIEFLYSVWVRILSFGPPLLGSTTTGAPPPVLLVPALLPAWLTGFALAFARGVGEYGSVIFIAGNMPMKTEILPLLIMVKLDQYDYTGATSIGVLMLVVSFILLLLINLLQRRIETP